jgi:hypothetical protein
MSCLTGVVIFVLRDVINTHPSTNVLHIHDRSTSLSSSRRTESHSVCLQAFISLDAEKLLDPPWPSSFSRHPARALSRLPVAQQPVRLCSVSEEAHFNDRPLVLG